jgi:protein SCO1
MKSVLVLTLVALASTAQAQSKSPTDFKSLLNVEVVDQDGQKHSFYDLVTDKVVALTYMYTTCKETCPIQGRIFREMQKALKKDLSGETRLISISVDPQHDTPEKLKAWGKKTGRQEGWTLLTGKPENLNQVFTVLFGGPQQPGFHGPVVYVGDLDRGVWMRTDLEDENGLVGQVKRMVEERRAKVVVPAEHRFNPGM